jgi:hypothetical protein
VTRDAFVGKGNNAYVDGASSPHLDSKRPSRHETKLYTRTDTGEEQAARGTVAVTRRLARFRVSGSRDKSGGHAADVPGHRLTWGKPRM